MRNVALPILLFITVVAPSADAQQGPTNGMYVTGELRGLADTCLDVRGPSTDNGTPVQIWECANVPQQRWQFVRP